MRSFGAEVLRFKQPVGPGLPGKADTPLLGITVQKVSFRSGNHAECSGLECLVRRNADLAAIVEGGRGKRGGIGHPVL